MNTPNTATPAHEDVRPPANDLETIGLQLGCLISANAGDISTVNTGDWFSIAPFGDHPSPDGSYTQHFDRAQSDRVVATWNSITGKAARFFKNMMHGLGPKCSAPVWDGHPDSDKDRWPKERLLAEITDLRSGNAGLEGRITWNAKGMDQRPAGKLFPSPLWWHNPPAGTPPTVYPELLESVGLVKTPNIASAPAWTQNALAGKKDTETRRNGETETSASPGLPVSESSSPAENQTTLNTMLKTKLIELLSLGAEATDEQIETAVKGAASTANALTTANAAKTEVETKLSDATQKLTSANSEISNLKSQISNFSEGVLNGFEKAGVFTPADREALQGRITANGADVTLIVGELIARKPAVNVRNVELNGNRVDISTANARRDAFGAAVAKRMKDEGLSYDDAFAKCYTDPALAGLTGAMGDPTKK